MCRTPPTSWVEKIQMFPQLGGEASSISHDVNIRKEMSTLQGTNISHLGKRKMIFKSALVGDMSVPRMVFLEQKQQLSVLKVRKKTASR